MLEYIDNFEFGLLCSLKPTDTEIAIPDSAIKRLNEIMKGNHVYISLHWLDKFEIVKFTKDEDLKFGKPVRVERDIETKGSKNFPMGSCAKIQWTRITMDEYIAQRGK